jgi:hypothetical protein
MIGFEPNTFSNVLALGDNLVTLNMYASMKI